MRDFSALGSASMNADIEKAKSGKGCFMKVRVIVLSMGVVGLFKKNIADDNDITAVTGSAGNADIDSVVE